MQPGEKKEYADYIVRHVDRRIMFSITDNEAEARADLEEARALSPSQQWMIVRHAHIIERIE